MAQHKLEFFFDCSSPWTYLAFEHLHRLLAADELRGKVAVDWRPILVGGIFNTVNPSVYQARANPVAVKAHYYAKDMADWARYVGIEIGQPPVFPVNSVKAMRGAFLALELGLLSEYASAVFKAYWTDLRDIAQDDVLADVVGAVGIDQDAFFQSIARDDIKSRLRANTDEVMDRGGFGSPTMFVDETDMYFGNDRLPLVLAALSR